MSGELKLVLGHRGAANASDMHVRFKSIASFGADVRAFLRHVVSASGIVAAERLVEG